MWREKRLRRANVRKHLISHRHAKIDNRSPSSVQIVNCFCHIWTAWHGKTRNYRFRVQKKGHRPVWSFFSPSLASSLSPLSIAHKKFFAGVVSFFSFSSLFFLTPLCITSLHFALWSSPSFFFALWSSTFRGWWPSSSLGAIGRSVLISQVDPGGCCSKRWTPLQEESSRHPAVWVASHIFCAWVVLLCISVHTSHHSSAFESGHKGRDENIQKDA